VYIATSAFVSILTNEFLLVFVCHVVCIKVIFVFFVYFLSAVAGLVFSTMCDIYIYDNFLHCNHETNIH